jgi:sulfonate transport system ATP-binding protein
MSAVEAFTPHAALTIREVSKSYVVDERPLTVLRNIALEVQPGEFVSIVGASGCGKSTLLRLVVGLDADYEGDILLNGRRIKGPGRERGIVFQEHRLFPWLTVEDNIALGLDGSAEPQHVQDERVLDNIALVGLSGFEKAYPHQLSGGMAQRAAIARSLVTQPAILLLDEPLGALDSITRAYLQNELLRIWQQERVTIIMVTHDVDEAIFLSDRVVVMEPRPGRIRSIVPVELEHPRQRASLEFVRLKESIIRGLSGE